MHEYVQKSTTTTLPRRLSMLNGGELSQAVAPSNGGISPSMGNRVSDIELLMAIVSVFLGEAVGLIPSISDCSNRLVPVSDQRVRMLLSQPKPIAITASNTAVPSPRLTHSPAPSDFFRVA